MLFDSGTQPDEDGHCTRTAACGSHAVPSETRPVTDEPVDSTVKLADEHRLMFFSSILRLRRAPESTLHLVRERFGY